MANENSQEKKPDQVPYLGTDLPPELHRTIQRKIESGEDEGVDEETFRRALDRAISPEKPDPES